MNFISIGAYLRKLWDRFLGFLGRLRKTGEINYAVPLSDEQAVALLVYGKEYSFDAASVIVDSWRMYAESRGYKGPIAWLVSHGFTLKTAPLVAPCYDRFEHLDSWGFTDKPTEELLAFWVPFTVNQRAEKNVEQMGLSQDILRKIHGLPEGHCVSFGSISLLTALILTYKSLTGKWAPENSRYAVSDTLTDDGSRLFVGGGSVADPESDMLRCRRLRRGNNGGEDISFFPLGVVELGKSV
jgi:hypothetical protein